MRRDLAPLLFNDDDLPEARRQRRSVVAPAERSPRALKKAQTKRTQDGFPVHSFGTLLEYLSSTVRDTCKPADIDAPTSQKITLPTPFQQRVFDLPQVKLTA